MFTEMYLCGSLAQPQHIWPGHCAQQLASSLEIFSLPYPSSEITNNKSIALGA